MQPERALELPRHGRPRPGARRPRPRASSRGASSSAWASPARSPRTRTSCSWTSRSARSTRSCAELQTETIRLQRELEKTVVFVTHDVDEAFLLGDQVVILEKGAQIAQIGSPTRSSRTRRAQFVAELHRCRARPSCAAHEADGPRHGPRRRRGTDPGRARRRRPRGRRHDLGPGQRRPHRPSDRRAPAPVRRADRAGVRRLDPARLARVPVPPHAGSRAHAPSGCSTPSRRSRSFSCCSRRSSASASCPRSTWWWH